MVSMQCAPSADIERRKGWATVSHVPRAPGGRSVSFGWDCGADGLQKEFSLIKERTESVKSGIDSNTIKTTLVTERSLYASAEHHRVEAAVPKN